MSTASDEGRRGREDARHVDAAHDRLGDGGRVDRVVRAGDAFLEGVELHLSGQRVAPRIGHLTHGS
jgi:hypothetical protein